MGYTNKIELYSDKQSWNNEKCINFILNYLIITAHALHKGKNNLQLIKIYLL